MPHAIYTVPPCRRLLALARQLGTDNERSKEEVRREMSQEYSAMEARLKQELAEQKNIIDQLNAAGSRAAEYIRSLQQQLQEQQQRPGGSATPGRSPSGSLAGTPRAPLSPRQGAGTSVGGASGDAAALQELLAQVQQELHTTRSDSSATVAHLQAQVRASDVGGLGQGAEAQGAAIRRLQQLADVVATSLSMGFPA